MPRSSRVAVALGAAAIAAGAPDVRAQGLALEGDGALPGRRATALGAFAGVVRFSDQVEIGNSYYDDQVPGLGMLIGVRGAAELVRAGTARLDVEAELRLAVARTDSGGVREAGNASVLGWRAHALFEILADEPVRPFLLAGLGAESLVGGTSFMSVPDTDLVLYGGAGAEVPVGRRSALRTDVRIEAMAARDGGAAAAFEAAVGWSFRFGGPGARVGRIQIADRPAPRPVLIPTAPPRPPPDSPPPPVASEPDGDRDGILAGDDRCPEQAEIQNGFADGDGCPDEVPADLAARMGDLVGVRFARGSVRLDRRSRPVLDELAAVLVRYPEVRVELGAHANATGKPERDLELTGKQAAYVKWYLVDKGVDERRIDAVGYGSTQMKYDHSTRVGRAANGRIELKLIAPKGAEAPPPVAPEARLGPEPFFLPAVPRPVWLSPYARAELPLFGPPPVFLSPR